MKRLANTMIVLLLTLCVVHTARAEPAWGVNCLSCHGEWQVGTLSVFGHDAVADPDESITGAPDRGPLPVFRVAPGQTGTLQAQVIGLDTGDAYAVELKRLRFPGVVTGGALDYADDCGWAYWGEPGKYYTDPAIGYSWGSGPSTFTFDIGVNYDTPDDYYNLVFSVVGRLADGSGLFCSEEHFYLQVTSSPMIGDFDGDRDVDWDDFSMFVACFTDFYGRIEAGCEPCDLDDDADIDCADWMLFRQAWTEPDDPPAFAPCASEIPTVSEWGLILMALLLVTAGTFVLRRQRVLVVTLSLALCCVPAALATDLNVTLVADVCDASTITVGPACEITYRAIGELSDTATGGLAVVVFDLEFDGGALPQADQPTELPMLSFIAPNGFCNNPSGYGGTPQGGKLIQVGGA